MGPKDDLGMRRDGVDLKVVRDTGAAWGELSSGSEELSVVWEMNLFLVLVKLWDIRSTLDPQGLYGFGLYRGAVSLLALLSLSLFENTSLLFTLNTTPPLVVFTLSLLSSFLSYLGCSSLTFGLAPPIILEGFSSALLVRLESLILSDEIDWNLFLHTLVTPLELVSF